MGLLEILLLIVLLMVLVGSLPVYPYSRSWGYYPSGLGVFLIVLLLLLVLF